MPYLYESLRDSSSAANLLASWPSGPCKSIPVVYPYHVRVEPASLRLLVPPVGLSRWHRGPVFVRAGDGVGRGSGYRRTVHGHTHRQIDYVLILYLQFWGTQGEYVAFFWEDLPRLVWKLADQLLIPAGRVGLPTTWISSPHSGGVPSV